MSLPDRQVRRVDRNATSQSPRFVVAQIGKVPVTPRIAPSVSVPGFQRKSVANDSPLTRPDDRENPQTPTLSSLTSNITPRSSARKHRSQQQPSPNGTPSSQRTSEISPAFFRNGAESLNGFVALPTTPLPYRHSIADSGPFRAPSRHADATVPQNGPTSPLESSSRYSTTDSPKFFHASDAVVPTLSNPLLGLSRATTLPPSSTFFYVNEVVSPVPSSSGSNLTAQEQTYRKPGASISEETGHNVRFGHRKTASVVESRTSPPKPSPRQQASTGFNNDVAKRSSAEFGVSPVRRLNVELHKKSPIELERPDLSTASLSPALVQQSLRSPFKTIESSMLYLGEKEQRRQSSGSSIASATAFGTAPGEFLYRAAVVVRPPAESLEQEPSSPHRSESPSRPAPIRPKLVSTSESLSYEDLAANARRERKVMDLEISNNSLLAINRSLEKEMRKQHQELRRYKRLSRSGRLSLTPMKGEIRTDSQSLESTEGISDASSEDSSLSDDSLSEEDQPPTADGDVDHEDARQRRAARDEMRLRMDLDEHRKLLKASQMMNGSLQRCIDRTDDLIRQGKRALEHSVRLSEIGGRVLTVDDLEGVNTPLGTVRFREPPSSDIDQHRSIQKMFKEKEKERDSGVDLLADDGD